MSEVAGTNASRSNSPLHAFFAACQFLTRVPVPLRANVEAAEAWSDLARGAVFFPLVGGLIGAASGLALLAFAAVLPFPVAVLLALAIEALITGALHEDAVADFCDAFGGGWTREDVLRILKDSRIGSFGVLGLVLAVGLRATGLIALNDIWLAAAVLIVSGAFARLIILAVMMAVPPLEGRDTVASKTGFNITNGKLLWAAALATPVWIIGAVYDWRALVVAGLIATAFVLWFRDYVMRRLGGSTGDCFGFAAYVGLIIATLAFARLH